MLAGSAMALASRSMGLHGAMWSSSVSLIHRGKIFAAQSDLLSLFFFQKNIYSGAFLLKS